MLTYVSGGATPKLLQRYSSLPEENRNKITAIADRHCKSNINTSMLPILGGVGVAGLAAIANPILGGIAVTCYIGGGLSHWQKNDRKVQAIRDRGILAPFLKGKEFREYLRCVGPDAVQAELQEAWENDLPVTGAGKRFMGLVDQPLEKRNLKTAVDRETTKAKAKAIEGAKANPDKTTQDKITTDVVTAYIADLRCTVLCAPPRTGKGIVATGMMLGFKAMYPGGVLFSFTIKQFEGEDWYFAESDYHSNPDPKYPIEVAKALLGLYQAWEESNSTAEAPSLLVIDEIKDTLLTIANVKMDDVDPELADTNPNFADWIKGKLISSATMNQCHKRYVLLVSPVSTASAMGFKDANSLNSYASFTLATPTELGFTEGNNGVFGTPSIEGNSPLFEGWYGLGWSKKAKQWFGVPKIDPEVIKLRESQPPNLNYFDDAKFGTPFDGLNDRAKATVTVAMGNPVAEGVRAVEAPQKQTPAVDETQVYEKLCAKIIAQGGAKITIAALKRSLSRTQAPLYSESLEARLLTDDRFDSASKQLPNGLNSISIWLKNDAQT